MCFYDPEQFEEPGDPTEYDQEELDEERERRRP